MITGEELERFVMRMDHSKVERAARGMTEPQRARLADHAVGLAEALVIRGKTKRSGARYRRGAELDERLTRHLARPLTATDKAREIPREMAFVADLARYAFCGDKALPLTAMDYKPHHAPITLAVLLDRRPKWLGGWLTRQLSHPVEHQVITWKIVRGLVRAGVLKRPLPDGYYALLASPWTRGDGTDTSPADLLRADPALFAHELWELFERDTRAFRRDAYFDPGWDWAATLVELARAGTIDRDRIVAATTRALAAGFQPATRRGLARLQKDLTSAPARTVKGTSKSVPGPFKPWAPRWTKVSLARVALADRPIGTVFTYRAGPFTCYAVKVAENRWLEPSGLGKTAEAEALREWRDLVAKPPRANSSFYLDDATVLLRMALVPASLRLSNAVAGS